MVNKQEWGYYILYEHADLEYHSWNIHLFTPKPDLAILDPFHTARLHIQHTPICSANINTGRIIQ